MISLFIVELVLLGGLISIIVDEIKYHKNIDPILKDMVKHAKRC